MDMNMVYPLRDRQEIEDLKAYLRKKNLRDYLLAMVGFSSALRISDILALRVNDIWDGKYPTESITVKEKKTGKTKTFAVTENLKKAIKEYIKEYKPTDLDNYVFFSRKGENKPLTRQRADQILSTAADWIGIKTPFSSHSLRKTFAYHAWRAGTDPFILMRLLNHSSPSQLLHYICVEQDEMDTVTLNLNL
jgi:integrase